MPEWAVYIAPMGFALALYGAIRTELLRKQTNNAEQQKEFQKLKNEMEILKVRLDPLLNMMNKRLSDMFHEHDDRWRVDRLVEKYQRHPEDMTVDEFNLLISRMHATYLQVKRGGPQEDTAKALAATIHMALLDGERNARRLKEQQQATDGPVQEIPWWTRLWRKWLSWTNS